MTSYSEVISVEKGDRSAQQQTTVEKDKRFLIRQQLYYLFHASRCTRLAYTTGQGDCQNQHCIMMRGVVKHINKCQLGKECSFQHCPSSKEIIKHWKNCNDVECQVCAPLRRSNNGRKQDNLPNKSDDGGIIYGEQLLKDKQSLDDNWRNPLLRIRPTFIIKLTDELLPVKVCDDVKNHPGYSEVNNYVKGFEMDIFQNSQNLNEYFYKLAEKFELVYRHLISKYRLKENENSILVNPAISRFENTNKQIESFYQLIKSQFEKFYPTFNSIPDVIRVKKEEVFFKKDEVFIKKECSVKEEEGYVQKNLTGNVQNVTISNNYSKIKQDIVEFQPNVNNDSFIKSVGLSIPAIEAKMSPDSTSIPKKDIIPGIQTWTKEELIDMFISIHQELFDDKESEPFKFPVNWELLDIPDYPTIVKHPMDLSTIKEKLINGAFKDPWEVVDDFWLMFNNAWLYNKKTSKVYKMCSTLAKIFESKVDDIMISCGFCCGREYVYLPQVLICCTPNVCLIVRDAVYYAFQNDKANGEKIIIDLTCDKYLCCEKCFNESNDDVHFINPENNSTPCKVKKGLLTKCRNNVKENEEFVYCRVCNRKWHKVCANYLEEIAKEAFACPTCVREKNIKMRTNIFKSKGLPQNHLSRYLENRVNNFLKDKDPTINEIVIRVLSSSDKVVEVKPGMKSHYCETCEMSETFKYRLKAIFAFQEIDGQEVCFFGLHVQEYGSDCPDPNSRRVYVAYLDSVHYFNPRKYRTDVYHEFLVGYLEYVKKLGFTMAHIWACPPGEGDDYIFHMHPPEQRLPKPKRLQEWYIKMLDKAMKENVVIDYKDIFSDALQSNMLSPTELPYFDGDYWPNALEDIFKEIDDESNKRRSHSDTSNSQEAESPKKEIISKNNLSKMDKKPKKRKLKKMNNITYKRKRSSGSDSINDVSRRVLELMEKRKENFFVIRLHTQIDAANLPEITDPDPLMSSDLMDGRDKFLCLAREKHLEFSSVRRAKFSTLVFCYELHQEQKNSILYTCNSCNKQIEVRYTCRQCEDFELCPTCFNSENHPHPLYKVDPDEESNVTNSHSTSQPTSELQDTTRARMVRYSQSLQHACQCRDVNCRINFCAKMKGMIKHLQCCTLAKNTCNICQSFLKICFVHAKFCNDTKCQVPNCLMLRYNWKQQGSQQRMQQAQLLRRRVALMQRGINTDQTPGQIINLQAQSADINQPIVANGYEPENTKKTNILTDTVAINTTSAAKVHTPQMELTHTPSNISYNNGNYSSEIRVTNDDVRLVFQQYTFCHRTYPIKEEFQKNFGEWLNSSPRFKVAFDILLKKSKHQNESINTTMYENAPVPIREPVLQKTNFTNYSQSQWPNDNNMLIGSYSQQYNFHNGDMSNSMIYDYNNMKQQRNLGNNPVYITSLPQNIVPSQAAMSDSMHMNMMPRMSYVSGPSYMNSFNNGLQCLPQPHTNMSRFPQAMINNHHKVTQVQNFHCLPIMQQHHQPFHDSVIQQGHGCNNVVNNQKLMQPQFPQYFTHNSQIDQLSSMPGSSDTNSPNGILQQNYSQMNGQVLVNSGGMVQSHQNMQQQTMINSMLIPSNQ